MKVTIGKDGCSKTWQSDFPEKVQCIHCGCTAHIAFVAHEGLDKEDSKKGTKYLCHLGKEEPYNKGRLWLHDCASVAVYFCTECLKPTAEYNQG